MDMYVDLWTWLELAPMWLCGVWIVVANIRRAVSLTSEQVVREWRTFIFPSIADLLAAAAGVAITALEGQDGSAVMPIVVAVVIMVGLLQIRAALFAWILMRARAADIAKARREVDQ